jgi:hypothetical protein
MKLLSDWTALVEQGIPLVGIEAYPADKPHLLQQFYQWGQVRNLPVYFWNPGYATLQQVSQQADRCILQSADLAQVTTDMIQCLLEGERSGIYVLEGTLEFDVMGQISQHRLYQLANAHQHLAWSSSQQYWVLLEEQIQLPPSLQPFLPILVNPLPDQTQVQAVVVEFCDRHSLSENNPQSQVGLARACQGLPIGEIHLVLQRSLPFAASLEQLAEHVLTYKKSKLRGRGLELISEPDVPVAAGMELLNARLERISTLLEPGASQYGLTFPKGMILWGPPGTGKSLAAKLAAKAMGVPLLAADWGSLRGATAYESEQNLRFLLQTAESMAPICLYFDDFDKGFAGWNSDSDGGMIRRQAAKFLTWMQEHQSSVFVVATVNRLGMLPVELQRRVDDIFFVDLPNEGARYDVFNLHLAKYFPAFRAAQKTGGSPWSDEQWRILLTEYRLCTPAEIANAVRRVAEEAYYRFRQSGQVGQPLEVNFKEMLEQRWQFTPAMIREENQMFEIRNNATYARPSAGRDRSRFARPLQELFGGEDEDSSLCHVED